MTSSLRGVRAAQVAAQAKINLRLRVLAREASGFHQIETLFLRLDLADVVRVRRTPRARSLDVSGDVDAAALGPTERNLAWRAAEAYLAAAGGAGGGGFAIELEKNIPLGGGLGGGSADAGAVLRAFDAIAPAPLGEPALLRIAATLGADVPFLASEHAYALAWGRGERLLPLPPPPARQVLLVVPQFGVSTAEAYGWLAADRAGQAYRHEPGMLDLGSLGSWEQLADAAVNDFESVVGARHPAIATIVAALRAAQCAPAMLSGSGSVVFGVLPPEAPLQLVLAGEALHGIATSTAMRVEPVSALD